VFSFETPSIQYPDYLKVIPGDDFKACHAITLTGEVLNRVVNAVEISKTEYTTKIHFEFPGDKMSAIKFSIGDDMAGVLMPVYGRSPHAGKGA
jgi:hypothetical protein